MNRFQGLEGSIEVESHEENNFLDSPIWLWLSIPDTDAQQDS